MQEVPDLSTINKDAIAAHLALVQRVRKKGALASIAAEKKEVTKHAAKESPTLYKVGDEVLVQVDSKKCNKVKGKGVTKPWCYTGKVVDCKTKINKYKVSTMVDSKEIVEWFSVTKLTSVTREQEKQRDKNTNGKCSVDTISPSVFSIHEVLPDPA